MKLVIDVRFDENEIPDMISSIEHLVKVAIEKSEENPSDRVVSIVLPLGKITVVKDCFTRTNSSTE